MTGAALLTIASDLIMLLWIDFVIILQNAGHNLTNEMQIVKEPFYVHVPKHAQRSIVFIPSTIFEIIDIIIGSIKSKSSTGVDKLPR